MSKIKPLDESNILDFLTSDTSINAHHDDPISESKKTVTLDELQPYDLNPRRSKNQKYDEILESIENVGLKFAFRITRKHPDDGKYSIRDGGNTRLEILWQLYLKYKKLSEEAENDQDKQNFLEKAESFYRIECIFIPFQNDIDSLSNHMIENEARCGTKFIERALVVAQYKKLFKDEDENTANDKNEHFVYEEPSSRVLAKRISILGWVVDHSHIVRYNYAANILIKYIPDALWAGAGEPVVTKIRKHYKAYDTFWLATDQGKQNPIEINDLFYKTLSEFDDDKVDLNGFAQELDMRLEDIVKIPSVSIMAEINALMNNSKRSLKHEPEALNHRLATKTDDTNSEVIQVSETSGTSDSTDNVKQAAKTTPDSTATKERTEGRTKAKETQAPSSTASNSNDTNDTSNVIQAPVQTDELPSDIPSLNTLVLDQLECIEKLTPGYLGISRMNDVNDAYVKEGVLYDVNNFYDPELHPCPVYGNPDDDMRTIIWWQLQKYSRDYMINNHGQFTKLMQRSLASYIGTVQKINPEHQLIDVILWLEHRLLLYPDIMKECVQLQRLQTRIIEVSKNQNQSME